jgi:hypothetical protein
MLNKAVSGHYYTFDPLASRSITVAAPGLRPNDLLVELTTSRFQSPDQLFFRGERQLVLAGQNLIYEVA